MEEKKVDSNEVTSDSVSGDNTAEVNSESVPEKNDLSSDIKENSPVSTETMSTNSDSLNTSGVETEEEGKPLGAVENSDVTTRDDGKKKVSLKSYAIAAVLVIIISLGLLFMLERGGYVNTGLFAAVIESMETKKPAAKVNGEVITKGDLDSGVKQLVEIASLQGMDVSDDAMKEQFENQALDTLINGEILRQKAISEGVEAKESDIDNRFSEISEGVGGDEVLEERMAEFGISKETLRKDIENEILIQGLFDNLFPETIEVTDEDVTTFYEENGGEAGGLPPLEDIKEQIIEQIRVNKENEQVGQYIEELRQEAEIEILI
ncbi:MAG: SurA N-terminal domain-containing protein [Candidatus Paceibacterota bacterium]